DKMESIVRASTELGVTRVVPALTARTIVALDPSRWRERARRWQRIAKEAAKQCGRAVVPAVDVPRALDQGLELAEAADVRLCLWEGVAHVAAGGQGGVGVGGVGGALAGGLPAARPRGSDVGAWSGRAGGFPLVGGRV